MRELIQAVVFGCPDAVIAKVVGEFHLFDALAKRPAFAFRRRLRDLNFEEN